MYAIHMLPSTKQRSCVLFKFESGIDHSYAVHIAMFEVYETIRDIGCTRGVL